MSSLKGLSDPGMLALFWLFSDSLGYLINRPIACFVNLWALIK